MPKRTSGDALDVEGISPNAKRSKLGDATNVQQTKDKNAKKAQAAAVAVDERVTATDDDDEGAEVEEDEKLEERIGAALQKQLDARRAKHGEVAECGVIETLYMENFMCHRRLSFKFGPQMNFIIGHNGSGKSAALSALTIALGGKTVSTGRGNGLKSFIKEGENSSLVRVGLKNMGDDAFRPEAYGPRLFVERRFTKEGSSAYKIYSGGDEPFKPGAVVSTRRTDLDAICDHMNIQVDNPLNILTQDSARQFLSASSARDKYKFFMTGTQLQQLADGFGVMAESIDGVKRQGDLQKDGLKDLGEARQRQHARYDLAEKAREMKTEKEHLNGELAWAHVATKRVECDEVQKPLKKARKNVKNITDHVEAARADVNTTTTRLQEVEEDVPQVTEADENETATLKDKIKALHRDHSDIDREVKACNETMNRIDKQIQDFKAKIAAENAKLELATQDARAGFSARISEKKAEVQTLEDTARDLTATIARLEADREQAQASGRTMDGDRGRLLSECSRIEDAIQNAQRHKHSALAVYHPNTAAVQRDIAQYPGWVGERPPLGPVGTLVELPQTDDGRLYGTVVRNVLGGQLLGYVVSDARDLRPLKGILSRHGVNVSITVAPIDIFDYRAGEPNDAVLTVLRLLIIKDDWVKRVLINGANIERTALAPDRPTAQRIGERYGIRRTLTADERVVRTYGDGGGDTNALEPLRRNDQRSMLLKSGVEVEESIRNSEREKIATNERIRELDGKLAALRQHVQTCVRDITMNKNKLNDLRRQINREKSELDRLQNEANAAAPVNMSGLELALADQEAEKENLRAQAEQMMTRKREIVDEVRPLTQRQDELRTKRERVEREARDLARRIEEAATAHMQAQKNLKHWETKLQEENDKLAKAEKTADIINKELVQWTKGAEELCPVEVERPRSVQALTNKIRSLERAVADHEAEQGASLEEIAADLAAVEKAYAEQKERVHALFELTKALEAGLSLRIRKWKGFQKHIAVRCKLMFQINLMNRGFFGKILFDHKHAKLSLRVQTEDAQTQAQENGKMKDKDPKSLSGGEKSFSTICLLLALWESINCPIRCLDEFDVFMDAVNRRVSMKMMMETAKASDSKQYILISPLGLDVVVPGSNTVVLRMDDPERGQARN